MRGSDPEYIESRPTIMERATVWSGDVQGVAYSLDSGTEAT